MPLCLCKSSECLRSEEMNRTFREVVNFYKGPGLKLTHEQQVTRLYRDALRLLGSWCVDREIFNTEAEKIRAQFDAAKHHPKDSAITNRLVREAQQKLADSAHPDRYIAPYLPGGSLYMRNSAVPLEAVFPDGIPEGVSQRRINVDMSNLPEGEKYAKKVFVDSANKGWWFSD